MMSTVWQPFVLSLGAPMSTLGLLESLGGMKGLLPSLIQFIGGWLSDRLGRKPFMALGSLATLASVSFYVLAAITGDWRWLLPGVILAGVVLIARPAQNSLVAESAQTDQRGMAYSILIVSWIAPGIFAPALGGFVADRWGFTPVFLSRLALEGLCLFIILRFLRETLRQSNGEASLGKLKGALVKIITPPRALRGFYWTMALDSFAWGIGNVLLFGMLSETYGFTTFQLGVMSSLQSIVWMFSQLPVGKFIDRFGCKPSMVFSEIMGVFILGGRLFSATFPAFAFLHACFGLLAATWLPAQRALLANNVSENERGEAMGRLAAFQGLGGFSAPYLGGLLYERFGFQAPILVSLICVTVVTLIVAAVIKERRPVERGLQ
jgi:MFS family permease